MTSADLMGENSSPPSEEVMNTVLSNILYHRS